MSLIERRNAAAAELLKLTDTAETLVTRDGFDPESPEFQSIQTDLDVKRAEVERYDGLLDTAARATERDMPRTNGGDWASEMVRSMVSTGKAREAQVPLDRAYAVLTSAETGFASQPTTLRPQPVSERTMTPTIDASTVVQVSGSNYRYITMPLAVAAQDVAEGGAKPAVEFASAEVSGSLGKVAHILDVTQELLEDEPAARNILSNWLIEGVTKKLEADAAAALVGGSGYRTIPAQTGVTPAVRFAVAELAGYGLMANAVVLNPKDHAELDLEVFSAAASNSQTVRLSSLWSGVSLIPNPAVPAGTIFAGDFKAGVLHIRRSTVSVDITDSGMSVESTPRDRFTHNLYGFRAEARAKTIVQQPLAIVKATWA